MKIDNLLVKPAGPDCNLGCDYCFYLKKKDDLYPGKNRMSLETAERMISQLMGPGNPVTFSWQGGEPTLMGLDFFKEVIDLQKKHGVGGQSVSNTLQTNGVLLDEEWARFLYRYNFLVGLSLDGPKDLHNAYRTYPDESGTWGHVMETAEILEDNLVPFNVLCVLNDKTVEEPERILDFFLSEGFENLQFIPAVETVDDGASRKIAPFTPDPLKFGKFLDVIFKKWSEKFPPRFSVRYFDALIGRKLGQGTGFCRIGDTCGNYLVVEHNGDVYPCDFFVESEWKLGNLKEDSIERIEKKDKFKSFSEGRRNVSKDCKNCGVWELCHGGCQRYRDLPTGPEKRTYLCKGYKYFLSKNLGKIEKMAERFSKMRGGLSS